ncbi:MAG: hypothetical protein IB618_01490 [Candidatus Pacearchaeota archaeon]|nr:MAG: hypothetical protein IB618_01490 [Candidatus Pacearchaeota archaeon]
MVFGKIFKRKRKGADVIDLGKLNEIQNRERILKEATTEKPDSNNMGFLGTMASAAGSESSQTTHVAVSGVDMEKFDRLCRRLDHLVDRFELLERKIERIEHRVDLKY